MSSRRKRTHLAGLAFCSCSFFSLSFSAKGQERSSVKNRTPFRGAQRKEQDQKDDGAPPARSLGPQGPAHQTPEGRERNQILPAELMRFRSSGGLSDVRYERKRFAGGVTAPGSREPARLCGPENLFLSSWPSRPGPRDMETRTRSQDSIANHLIGCCLLFSFYFSWRGGGLTAQGQLLLFDLGEASQLTWAFRPGALRRPKSSSFC